MTTRSPARIEFLTDILTTAAEGGINYWARLHQYRWDVPAEQRRIVLSEREEPEPVKLTVTLDTIAKGLGLVKRLPADQRKRYAQLLLADRTNGVDGDYDADDANVVVQLALLDDVVYG